ncbi:MAG: hypothetical protein ACPGN3_04995 [Opitutales bacterium]
MHERRSIGYGVVALPQGGEWTIVENRIDKRPLAYPFLVSIAHDLTGFRAENSFWVNKILAVLFLVLVFLIGKSLTGSEVVGVAVLLAIGSLPLLYDLASAGGFDLLSLVLIALLILLSLDSVRLRGDNRLHQSVLMSAAVLLWQTRYETVVSIFIIAPFLIWLWRSNNWRISFISILIPLFCIPIAWLHRLILANPQIFTRDGSSHEAPFAISHLLPNGRAALEYLFSISMTFSNSALLSGLGILSLLAIFVQVVSRRFDYSAKNTIMLVSIVGLLGLTLIFLSYFWGEWTSYETARFSLPLNLAFALSMCLAGFLLHFKKREWKFLSFVFAGFIASSTLPKNITHAMENSYVGLVWSEVRLEAFARLPDSTVYLDYATTPAMLQRRRVVDLSKWADYESILIPIVEDRAFPVVVFQEEVYDRNSEIWRPKDSHSLPERVTLEPIFERIDRPGYSRIMVSKITSWVPSV